MAKYQELLDKKVLRILDDLGYHNVLDYIRDNYKGLDQALETHRLQFK